MQSSDDSGRIEIQIGWCSILTGSGALPYPVRSVCGHSECAGQSTPHAESSPGILPLGSLLLALTAQVKVAQVKCIITG